MTWLQPVVLRGSRASLAPLDHGHANDLVEALHDGELWKLWYTSIPAPDKLGEFIDRRLAAQAQGTCLPFAVLDHATGRAVGVTNYLNVEPDHRRVEIGGTWYRKSVQRTQVNTQCKLLLLAHAFDALRCIAVEFRTHFFQRAKPPRNREAGRETGRRPAQPSDRRQRNAPRHVRLQYYCQRVADREGAPDVADGETKAARSVIGGIRGGSSMRVKGGVAALLIGCAAALAEDTKPIDFSGDWWSYRCGHAILVEQGSLLSGQYIPSSGLEAGRKLPLTGFRSGMDLIAFVVNFGSNGPISAWAGQHTVEDGVEKIITQWHMTIDVPDEEETNELYKSIWSGADVFVRTKPGRCN